jgi:general secretion pathway protein K
MDKSFIQFKPQQGIALITILVMVALATIIAASIAKHQSYTNESTGFLKRQSQALFYAKSAEAFYSEILVQDSENGKEADYLQETWAKPMPAFPVEDGYVSGVLEDESGKFNLNSLLNTEAKPNEAAQKYFSKLLVRVGLPADNVQAVIDWQDPDNETIGAMGAETSYYQGLPKPYSATNRKFASIEELKLVRGFEGTKYDLIAPYISALPDINTRINVNTAPAMVLAAINEKLDVNSIQTALNARQEKLEYFANVGDLMKISPFDSLDATEKTEADKIFGVRSNYFKAKIEVLLSNRKRQFTSHLLRNDQSQVFVYSRSLAPF